MTPSPCVADPSVPGPTGCWCLVEGMESAGRRNLVIGRATCALARDVCRVAEMQDLVLGHALLAMHDQAVPGLHGLLCLGALRLQKLQLGAEALAGELTVPFVLLDVLLHMLFTGAPILVAPLRAH